MWGKTPSAFIFDLDGTLYIGNQAIEGAADTIKWVRDSGAKIKFVTNNPRHSRKFYSDKLVSMGIQATVEEIVTSAQLTALYLKDHPEYGKLYVIGEEQLFQELWAEGLPITDDDHADTVIVSFDTTLTYAKLLTGYKALLKGAHFIATNPDTVCPTPDGGLVDAGAIIAALEVATGRKVETVIGKPSKLLGELLLADFKVPPDQCMIVGDRLNTDIRLGKQAGMMTGWINPLKPTDIPDELKPDFIFHSIAELPSVFIKNSKQKA
ncbi:HAD-IIA family hydrolase [Tuberibacillus calidus]|uniref:HAD-IIA family hydrolase n=1 Tax=Tuberibacillus calidus TaxID=340097 RepID=UPI000427BC24|nr:HAD-IIA family hydrolase [Tuberibacillus calidus]